MREREVYGASEQRVVPSFVAACQLPWQRRCGGVSLSLQFVTNVPSSRRGCVLGKGKYGGLRCCREIRMRILESWGVFTRNCSGIGGRMGKGFDRVKMIM